MVLLVREDLPEEVLLAVRTGWVKESGVVSSTISPPAINTTRWAARRAKPISWGTTSLVVIPLLGSRGHHVEDTVGCAVTRWRGWCEVSCGSLHVPMDPSGRLWERGCVEPQRGNKWRCRTARDRLEVLGEHDGSGERA
jgi:hypothetical protein